MEPQESWPLSAAATEVLLRPRTHPPTILKLAIKELVVVGHARLLPETEPHKRGTRTVMYLRPGAAPVPPRVPLTRLSKALFADSPEGGPLSNVVAAAHRQERNLPGVLGQEVLDELTFRDLVVVEKKFLRTVVTRTTAGNALAAQATAVHDRWRVAVETGGPAAAAAILAATATPGLVLLMDRSTLSAIDTEVRRDQEGSDASFIYLGAGSSDDDRVHWSDLDAVDGLSGLDAAVNPGVDVGSADSNSGADGGDGGGGGGD